MNAERIVAITFVILYNIGLIWTLDIVLKALLEYKD
jgi:hypothetical protein